MGESDRHWTLLLCPLLVISSFRRQVLWVPRVESFGRSPVPTQFLSACNPHPSLLRAYGSFKEKRSIRVLRASDAPALPQICHKKVVMGALSAVRPCQDLEHGIISTAKLTPMLSLTPSTGVAAYLECNPRSSGPGHAIVCRPKSLEGIVVEP